MCFICRTMQINTPVTAKKNNICVKACIRSDKHSEDLIINAALKILNAPWFINKTHLFDSKIWKISKKDKIFPLNIETFIFVLEFYKKKFKANPNLYMEKSWIPKIILFLWICNQAMLPTATEVVWLNVGSYDQIDCCKMVVFQYSFIFKSLGVVGFLELLYVYINYKLVRRHLLFFKSIAIDPSWR